ncbi:mitochondrial intermembrane space translocase subunit Tim [Coccidioides immitis RS]|uniref:Mitochondrial import inner membrane translocase subunit n=6 Tax=Coccidioides TaxID=5500 RepID=J3KFG0_COCIM|nr:mitochondrial intermembrane space translocase subunit Tim [Coccidioides immitis RS]XP_003067597.1 Tim10/DDP family zinc finger containing protein [Coccidioides posadasii C735 delta SOWgp]EFW17553.1 mitochondrial intermembrane space translocase subunit Tim [Coccidioides posadasii str. Silveira]KMM70797.1 hypothetical protein CPAG_07108 [Coccidioides posadasii RMSCC 3488]KMP05502.1 hypothetical protein CIRG_05183 [Coccidioides immitis RMSCC 2394]KMU81390.1 hypothetical protein CISG_09078 [Coc|eukprot:XP_003067597.1 Tim10/DDP family zinc finger containing protein [Coccidioides posadasii C735 delta SOWgp]
MAISNPFASDSSPQSTTSAEMKAAIIQQLQSESAITNARTLMEKINSNCFEKCISSPPGSTFSSKDQTCLTACMEKYISLWNATSRAYVSRLSREQEKSGLGGGNITLNDIGGGEGSF